MGFHPARRATVAALLALAGALGACSAATPSLSAVKGRECKPPDPRCDGDGDGGTVDSGATDGGTDSGGTDDGGIDSGGTDDGGTDSGGPSCQPAPDHLGADDAAVRWSAQGRLQLTGENMRIVGDIDGDGIDDLAIGARGFGDEHGAPGAMHLVYGGADLEDADTSALPTVFGEHADDGLGFTVEPLGDLDGDGIDDLAVSAREALSNTGRTYIVFGREARLGTHWMGELDDVVAISGKYYGDLSGTGLAGGFDHDGDGLTDLLISSPFRPYDATIVGNVAIVYGEADRTEIPTWLGDTAGFRGVWPGGRLGTRFALGGGDLDGDGLAEAVMAAGEAQDSSAGEVYVFAGREARRSNPELSVFQADVLLEGPQSGNDARFGYGVDLGGDFDGDGYPDLAVGAYFDDRDGPEAGRAWLWRGGPTALERITGLGDATLELRGAEDTERLGRTLRLGGDVDGDGDSELLVGRIGIDDPDTDAGSALLIYGCPDLSGTLDLANAPVHWRGTDLHQYLGYSLDLGDLTGDGLDDVLIGAPGWNGSAGQVMLYPGGSF